MATVFVLKPLLIAHRNELLIKLERKYNDYIANILNQKMEIAMKIQQQFDDQMERIHREEIKCRVEAAQENKCNEPQEHHQSHPEDTAVPIECHNAGSLGIQGHGDINGHDAAKTDHQNMRINHFPIDPKPKKRKKRKTHSKR